MGSKSIKVFILAGGKGTRIRSLFPNIPKALIIIQGKPFLEHQIQLLAKQGFRDFVLCLGYLAEQIVEFFGDGSRWGVNIEYSIEEKPLGTAGAINFAKSFFQDTSLILNGDTYLKENFQALIDYHEELVKLTEAIGTIVLISNQDTKRYGNVAIDQNGRIEGFWEKTSDRKSCYVNAGAYVLEPKLLNYISDGKFVSLEKDIFPALLDEDKNLYSFLAEGSFIDIGTPHGYHATERIFDGK